MCTLRARVHTHTCARTRTQLPLLVSLPDYDWLVGQTRMRLHTDDLESSTDNQENDDAATHGTEDAWDPDLDRKTGIHIPTWFGYHSQISQVKCVTRVGTPPLIAAPAHVWQTLLTVLMQAQWINTKLMEPTGENVI
jgi:hypothetical protein